MEGGLDIFRKWPGILGLILWRFRAETSVGGVIVRREDVFDWKDAVTLAA